MWCRWIFFASLSPVHIEIVAETFFSAFFLCFFGSTSWPWLKQGSKTHISFGLFSSCIIKIIKIYVCNKRVLRMMGKFFSLWWFSYFPFLFLSYSLPLLVASYCLENFYDTFFTPSSLRKTWNEKHILTIVKIAMTITQKYFLIILLSSRLKSTVCRILFLSERYAPKT